MSAAIPRTSPNAINSQKTTINHIMDPIAKLSIICAWAPPGTRARTLPRKNVTILNHRVMSISIDPAQADNARPCYALALWQRAIGNAIGGGANRIRADNRIGARIDGTDGIGLAIGHEHPLAICAGHNAVCACTGGERSNDAT